MPRHPLPTDPALAAGAAPGSPAPDVPAPRRPEPAGAAWVLPEWWPSAWPSLLPRLLRRVAFVVAVEALTVVGLALVADLVTQWWVLLPPLLLLVGPVTAPSRARRRLRRAAADGRLTVDADGLVRLGAARGRPVARLAGDGTPRYLR